MASLDTVSTGSGTPAGTDSHPPKDSPMKTSIAKATLLRQDRSRLSLLLAASAHAADRASLHAVDKVNLNTADAATIDRVLLNIGPPRPRPSSPTARPHGGFKSPEQLALVKGIGLKTVEKNRDRIVIGGSAVPARPAARSRRPRADPAALTRVAQGSGDPRQGMDAR